MQVDHDQQVDDLKQKIWVAVNDNDEDIMCDICLDDFKDDADAERIDDLVMCDFCNVAVH